MGGITMIAKYTRQQRVDLATRSTSLFIGRQRELNLIWDLYHAARNGNANVVLLSGEPGIGKTRLIDEVGELATKDGAIVLHGGASEAEGMPPYLPFLEALGRHIQLTPLDQLRMQVAPVPQVLATLLPCAVRHNFRKAQNSAITLEKRYAAMPPGLAL
jgi:predicted ATPase